MKDFSENDGMKKKSVIALISGMAFFALAFTLVTQGLKEPSVETTMHEIDAFNQKMTEVTLHMDNEGTMELWAEDGITLLPGMAPVKGKKNIAKFLDDAVAGIPGWKVTKQEDNCHDIEVTDDEAT